ncbi:MAG: hypothetical protein CL398_10420 [Acidiferrobacteraceae bacterium]|nr:hypothetical protein [Acidiferrobacteraceae bacterium]|tara:strand:- start:2109 stop:3089 length:981 start_codon:yes stop_codon:yes gene_type:complete
MGKPAALDVRHVVVDTDTGIDDALALLYLAGKVDTHIAAITSVYGNTEIESALSNIARVLEVAQLEETLVARGASSPLVGQARIASHVHGGDGLGDIWSDQMMPKNVAAINAAHLLVELGNKSPGYYDLLLLGPLTNVGLALEIDPNILTRYRKVVIMGGSGPFPPLGTVQMVDANTQNDPEAATRVYGAQRTSMVMVGVNITAKTILDENHVDILRKSDTACSRFAIAILEAYMNFYQYAWGRRVSPVHDGLAAGLLLQPEWITEAAIGPIEVTTDGYFTRGHLACTADGAPVSWLTSTAPETLVVLDANKDAFISDFINVLSAD